MRRSSGRALGLCISSARRRLGRDLPPIPQKGMDMQRTFPAPYVDARVKRPDFPLAEALAWYMADKPSLGEGTAATTMRTYSSHLRRFIDWLDPELRTLRSLEPETYERYVRATTTNQNTRMNKIVAAKSFARYL